MARTPALAPLRLLRAGSFAAAILCLSAAAHVAGGGTLPAPAVVIALGTLTLLPVMILAGRKLGAKTTAAVLGASQLLLHQAFTVLSTTALCTEAGHHAYAGSGSLECLAATAHTAGEHGAGMVAAHVLATVLTGLLLVRGEDALWALAAWLRPLTRLPAAVVLPVRRSQAPAATPRELRTLCQLALEPLRGPPALSFH
ncbi:hypothetical protein D477_021238 [Arthrobacter crystallopoietes BAB-32]|uniref:Integral membrane protein n=1 Tax=Arthrobacter crystallopoietes BAB-32 TaxID=1246476 RepID=N1UWU2_9MICC|nr:hypothetical protein [Arthrobacter crystallopoietes]EMY32229.1 hypothetical protein D477_021238 [Arthrobacter crystallopoietes BAB-32]